MNQLKNVLRPFVRYRYFTVINIIGLSVGIAGTIVIGIYTASHLRTDTFHTDAARIYRLVVDIETPGGETEHEPGSALPMHDALRREFDQVQASAFCMKFYSTPTLTVHTNGKRDKYREENSVAYASQNFLQMFNHEFLVGNKSGALTAPGQAVLSQELAVKYFGSVDGSLGQLISINNMVDVTVTGVYAETEAHSDLDFGMLVSLPTIRALQPYYQLENFAWVGSNNWTFVKLREHASTEVMERQLVTFGNRYLGPDLAHWRLRMQPLSDMHFDLRYDGVIKKSVLWILLGVAAMLLLVVSVNYINLTVAQAHHRAKEIAIRKYVGAGKRQLFFQFISETSLMVFVSFLCACIVVQLALPILNEWVGFDLRLDAILNIGFAGYAIVFLSALILIAGYYPAIHLSGFNPLKAISGTITNELKGQNFGNVLLIFQYTVAIFFSIATTAIVKQVNFMMNNDPGFRQDNVINVRLPRVNFSQMVTFRNEVANLSGVRRASLHNQPPMSDRNDGGFITFDNRLHMEDFIVRERWADENFLETYSIQLIAGRNFAIREDTVTEVLVNESMLRKLDISNPEDALAKKVILDNSSTHAVIAGVVRNFHHRSLQSEIEPLVINPMTSVFNQAGICIHPHALDQTIANIRRSYLLHFPNELFEFSFVEDTTQRMYQVEDNTSKLMTLFTIMTVVISLIGMLGLSAFSNLKRTREMAIRKVLGAGILHVIGILSRQYAILFSVGFLLAAPVTYWLMVAWLNEFAYHIDLDLTMVLVPGMLLVVIGLLFVSVQSFKTALMNVAEAIRRDG